MDCDAIVNAANNSLMVGGGVDGAIHHAAGSKLNEACRIIAYCPTGEAVITPGFLLKAKYIIHTVGPVYSGDKKDELLLSNCYYNSLNLAKDHNIHSIAFPCISNGVYGYPLKKSVPVVLDTINKWMEKNNDYDIDIYLVCFQEKEYSIYDDYLKKHNQ